MINIFIKIFLLGLFINLLYELLHSLLYKTCIKAPLKKYVYLIVKASIFDGIAIAIIYFLVRKNLFLFYVVSILFAYFWEIYSIKKGKWEYTNKMPKIFGAGLTPTIQLFITGLLSIYLLNNF